MKRLSISRFDTPMKRLNISRFDTPMKRLNISRFDTPMKRLSISRFDKPPPCAGGLHVAFIHPPSWTVFFNQKSHKTLL